MPNYVCKNCNYRFVSNENPTERPCPYCGEKKVIEDKDAEELVSGQ